MKKQPYIKLVGIKEFLNNSKIFVEQKNNSKYKLKVENGAMTYGKRKAYFTYTTYINNIVYSIIPVF